MEKVKDSSMNRVLGLKEAITITVGTVIGVGLFTVGANGVGYLGYGVILATFCAFLVSIIPALLYAEMGSSLPYAGGTYYYASKGLGKIWGMLAGWNFVISLMAVASGEALAFSFYFTTILEALKIPISIDQRIIAAIVILIFMYINYKGVKIAGKLQNGLMFFFWGIAIVWFVTMIPNLNISYFNNNLISDMTPSSFIFITALIWWCFAGFETCCAMGEEIKYPQVNIPRAIILAPFIVFIVTSAFQFFLVGIVPVESLQIIAESTAPYADGMKQAGIIGFPLVMLCLGIAFGGDFSTLNSCIAAPSRYLYSMAKDGVIPSVFAKLHPKYKSPYVAIIFLGIAIMSFIYIGEILYIASLSLFSDLFYYIIGFIAFVGLRIKEKDMNRPFKAPFGIPFAVISIVIYLIMMKELDKAAFITGVIWSVIGVIVYLFFSNKNSNSSTDDVNEVKYPNKEEKKILDKEFKIWSIVVGVIFALELVVYLFVYIS